MDSGPDPWTPDPWSSDIWTANPPSTSPPPALPATSVVTPLPPAEVVDAQATVAAEYQDKPHRGSKTPYIIFGLAIALIVIFAIVVVVFFLLGNPPATYQLSLVNNTPTDLAVSLNNYVAITLAPTQRQTVFATPGALLKVSGYNTNVGLGGPQTVLTLWLANQSYTGTPYLIINGVRQNAPASNNNGITDQYQIDITNGYNLAIDLSVEISGASYTNPIWADTGQCPSNLLYPGPTGFYACATPCYTFGSSPSADYCCTDPDACGVTGTCVNSWASAYADFRAVCSGCNISNCDQILFWGTNSQSGVYNPYQLSFSPIEIVPIPV